MLSIYKPIKYNIFYHPKLLANTLLLVLIQ